VCQVLAALRVEQAAQRCRQLAVHVRRAKHGDALVAGRVEQEQAVAVLDVHRLRAVGQPVDVWRAALGDTLVEDAEEFPEAADLRLRAGQQVEVGARQTTVRAQPGRRVTPRVDGHLGDGYPPGEAGAPQVALDLHQHAGRHRAHLATQSHRRREDQPLSAKGS
jgi:hypothetical protein